MSEEMAISDSATGEDATVHSDSATVETVTEAAEELPEQPNEVPTEHPEEQPTAPEGNMKLWHITYYLIC